MNSIIETQAKALGELCERAQKHHKFINEADDLKAHLYLESMQVPVDIQDKILNAIHRLKTINADKILIIIEHCSKNQSSERLLH